MDEDEGVGYKWEGSYGLNLHEAFNEDDTGSVEKAILKLVEETKKRRREQERPSRHRIGVIRYMYIVVDYSSNMMDKSLPPDRLRCTQKALKIFVHSFFRENPLSQLGIIIVKNRASEIMTPLTANLKEVEEGIDLLNVFDCSGDFSLHNGVARAYYDMQGLPMHSHREVLVIMSAMNSVDVVDIFSTMESLKRNQIIVHGIQLACELYALRKMCAKTRGKHNVALNEVHLDVVLSSLVVPPTGHRFAKEANFETFYCIGFPKKKHITNLPFCLCHASDIKSLTQDEEAKEVDLEKVVKPYGFLCVKCGARVCSLPVDCPSCGLKLATATQIAKTQMHTVPLSIYAEREANRNSRCFGCNCTFAASNDKVYICPTCNETFCDECDADNHESMICSGCDAQGVKALPPSTVSA